MFQLFWVGKNTEPDLEFDIGEQDDIDFEDEVGQIVLDVLEEEGTIAIIAPIAWVDLEDLDIVRKKTILTIKWHRKKPDLYLREDIEIRNEEVYFWKFIRNVILPENADFKKIKASMENNMLIITIPKIHLDSQDIKINRIES